MMLADFNPASLGFTDFAALSSPAVNGHGDHSTETNDTLSSGHILQPVLSAAPAFGGQVKNVIEDIIKRKQRGERVVLVSRQAKRLSSLLEEAEQTVTPLDTLQAGDPPPPSGSITLLQGMLIEGLDVAAGQERSAKRPAHAAIGLRDLWLEEADDRSPA